MNTLLLAALLTSSATGLHQAPAQAAESIDVPFKLLPSRHMLLEVKINDKGPYKLIFDTGAPINLVSSRLAKATGLTKGKSGGFGLGSLFGGVTPLEIAEFKVGQVKAEKLPAVVMDHPTVGMISDAFESQYGKIDGIVGFPFFGRYATTVDYQKKVMTFKKANYQPGDYIQDLTKNLTVASERKSEPRVVAATGLWGFRVEKGDSEEPGVVVNKIYADTPADKAGLKIGDRILTLDGRWTDSVADLLMATSLVKIDRATKLIIKRAGEDQERTIVITPVKGF